MLNLLKFGQTFQRTTVFIPSRKHVWKIWKIPQVSIVESRKGMLDPSFAISIRQGLKPSSILWDPNYSRNLIPTNVGSKSEGDKKTGMNDMIKNYMVLSKIRLTSMVVLSSMTGYAVTPTAFELSTFLMCSLGTGLLSSAACSINQIIEAPFDAKMNRTKHTRPLVTGALAPLHAAGFSLVTGVAGFGCLYFGCNELTAMLGATNLLIYTLVYTPMKRFSIRNTWVGAVVGLIPPMMGWAACAGEIGAGAWILGGILYAWQFPHFNALSVRNIDDYTNAGYKMTAVTDMEMCGRVALRYAVAICGLTLALPVLDVTNYWFALETLPINGYFTYLAWRFYRKQDESTSDKLFWFSLYHLSLLMILLVANKKKWIFAEEGTKEISDLK